MTLDEIVETLHETIKSGARVRGLLLPLDFAEERARNGAQALVELIERDAETLAMARLLLAEAEKFCPVELQDRIRAWRKELA